MNSSPAGTHIFDDIPQDGKDRKRTAPVLMLAGFTGLMFILALLETGRFFLNSRVPYLLEAAIAMASLALAAGFVTRGITNYMDGVHDKVSRRNRQLATLYRTGMAINSPLGLNETIQLIVDEARTQTGASAGKLFLKKHILAVEGEGHAVFYSGFDPSSCMIQSESHLIGLNGLVLKTNKPLRVDSRQEHPGSAQLPPGHMPFESVLSVPLTEASGDCIGSITLVKEAGPGPFTSDDEALLVSFANQAAMAIVKASLYEQVRHLSLLEERERIAREMHDGLGQIFAYMSIELKILEDLLASGDIEKAMKRLEPLRLTAEETSVDVRETIVNLRTPLLPEEDLQEVLGRYLRDFAERNEIKTVLTLGNGGAPPDFTRPAQIQLICIIQEALANVRKHARAQNVEVKMLARNGSREVWVIDDGCGFSPADVPDHGKHLGLTMMEERAREEGGVLKIESEPGKGTMLGIVFAAGDR